MLPLMVIVLPFFLISALTWIYRKFFQSEIIIQDKIIMITGASSGLGEALAKRYAKSGAKLVLCARNLEELKRVKKEISQDESSDWPVVYKMDITKLDDIKNCVKDVEEKLGPIDILLSNAGVSQRGSVVDTVIDVHKNLMDVNYFGPVNLVKAVLPSMLQRKQGSIISIGSVQGRIAIPFRAAYAASKHAGQAFFDSLRAEVAKDNINVTVVNPGYIKTNLSKNALSIDGTKHGILDGTTASGMSPAFVATHVFDSTTYPVSELNLGDMAATAGIYLRTLFSPLYFKYMEYRANSGWKDMKKSS